MAPSERVVTEGVAALATEDPAFAIALARALLRTAAAGDGAPARRANELLPHVPRKRIQLRSEHHVPHDRLRDAWRGVFRSRIDWVFLGDSFALAVEVKTRSRTGFGPRQLDSYHDALKTINKPHSGLLALTPIPPFKDELLARRRPFFVGAILWSNAQASLRSISPSSPDGARLWSEILDGIFT